MSKDNHKQLICWRTQNWDGNKTPPNVAPVKRRVNKLKQFCWSSKTEPQVQGAETAPQTHHTF